MYSSDLGHITATEYGATRYAVLSEAMVLCLMQYRIGPWCDELSSTGLNCGAMHYAVLSQAVVRHAVQI